MLTTEILSQLTPSAVKLLLTLESLADPRHKTPRAHAPLKTLIERTSLSRATCLRALAQLQQLNLIESYRPNRRLSATYLLLTSTSRSLSPVSAPIKSHPSSHHIPHPIAHEVSLEVSPMIPRTPPAPSPTPAPAPKTPNVPPVRPQHSLLSGIMGDTLDANTMDTTLTDIMAIAMTPFEDLLDPATIKYLMKSLSPQKNAEIVQIAQAAADSRSPNHDPVPSPSPPAP